MHQTSKRFFASAILVALLFSLFAVTAFGDEVTSAAYSPEQTEQAQTMQASQPDGMPVPAPEDIMPVEEPQQDEGTAVVTPGVLEDETVPATDDSAPTEGLADAILFTAAEGAGTVVDYDSASEYIDGYSDNVVNDENFGDNLALALTYVKEVISKYATFWSLVPPIIAIVLALITKEVYSSLFIGIFVGALIYSGGNIVNTVTHTFDVMIGSIADSWNAGILMFLVILGIIVTLMNKAGGSAAYGRWASKKIKTKTGAQLSTFALGVLIFVDDYFNCLTVGSVMRPVTDKHGISRAKLAYLIDATAAPVCIIAPISSWAAAVSSVAPEGQGLSMFIRSIPFNFYALLTIVMIITISLMKFDYGSMKKHELNAAKGDLYTTAARPYKDVNDEEVSSKGKVIDLVLPIIVLIISCIFGMVYTGGFFDGTDFVTAFADCDASVGLVLGSFIALVFVFLLYIPRKVISFRDFADSFAKGFKAMVPAILILVFAWTLSGMTKGLGSQVFVAEFVRNSGAALKNFLPAIIFLIALGLAFATGTSWGTFGILLPIVTSLFAGNPELMIISVAACLGGAVCGDHCSPISDTTIMASTGAQSDHVNHVSTQLPYALTVAGVSFVSYIIAGFVNSVYIALPIAIVLMVGTLAVIKAVTKKKAYN